MSHLEEFLTLNIFEASAERNGKWNTGKRLTSCTSTPFVDTL